MSNASVADVLSGSALWAIETANAVDGLRRLPEACVQLCATSPPYFGLRDYGLGKWQIGLEETPAAYVSCLVEVFREVRRVLRPDGLLVLNLGDSFASGEVGRKDKGRPEKEQGWAEYDYGQEGRQQHRTRTGLPPKSLLGIPWRVAFTLQDDGWVLRNAVMWPKMNAMPESVRDRLSVSHEYLFLLAPSPRYFWDQEAVRRPTAGGSGWSRQRDRGIDTWGYNNTPERVAATGQRTESSTFGNPGGRNLRTADIWRDGLDALIGDVRGYLAHLEDVRDDGGLLTDEEGEALAIAVNPTPFHGAHFAVWPETLVAPFIRAGTSEVGQCVKCGKPWRRVVERTREAKEETTARTKAGVLAEHNHTARQFSGGFAQAQSATQGWQPSCSCNAATVPQCVLDPFAGSGTTGVVARRLGRRFIGFDLSEKFCAMARARIGAEVPLLDCAKPSVADVQAAPTASIVPPPQRGLFDGMEESP